MASGGEELAQANNDVLFGSHCLGFEYNEYSGV